MLDQPDGRTVTAPVCSIVEHNRVIDRAIDSVVPGAPIESEGVGLTNRSVLLDAAREAAKAAYAPYSKFRVGAAVVADGRIYRACNVENASFGLAICAERAAIFAAAAAGARRIDAIAVACIDAADSEPEGARLPCGACRQVMAEFAGGGLPVHVDGVGSFRLDALLPNPFVLR